MARAARSSAATPATPSTPAATPPIPRLASAASAGANAGAAAGPSGASSSSTPAAGSSRPTRTSTRSRRSVGGAVSSPASSAGPLTPADLNPPSTPLGSAAVAKTNVAPKVHGLRNAHTARERVPCPFPTEFGGQQQCGVADEDLADEVLMAICGSCATMGNVALSPDEIASVAFEHGWLRPPSVAVAPGTMIQNAIRTHQSRCSKSSPARKPLLVKYQLSGSMAEAVLEPALHPEAFEGSSRPKGPVWYLSPDVGRAKWRNPFAGIVVPKAPVRKPAAPRQRSIKPALHKDSSSASRGRPKKDRSATPASVPDTSSSQPPRIKLRLSAAGGDAASQLGEDSDAPSAVETSRDTSRSQTVDSAAFPCSTPPTSPPPQRRRQRRSVFDSSDSDSSSDDDAAPQVRPSQRRIVLPTFPPIAGGNQRFAQQPRMSPLGELFFSPIHTPSQPSQPLPGHSPFPCHSLDNTIWGARRSIDDEPIGFDTSSSEDEEMRDPDWGTGSGVIVKAEEEQLNAELPEGIKQLEVEAKVAATTSAMSKLFSIDEPPAATIVYNQLDNVSNSDNSSHTESSTTTVNLMFQGKLKSATCSNALPAWSASSPVHSPNMAGRSLPAFVETSPTSFFRTARDWESRTMAMDVGMDQDESWLDESGQLPVHAEESFSDLEVGSTVGDISTPERDRALHTAEWAQTTSALSMNIKQEPEDYYPSPAATSEHSSILSEPSRESSVSTASSPLSELPDLDSDENDEDYGQEVLMGPESVHIDELDSWLPGASKSHATPGRGRGRTRQDPSRSSWGGIGVNTPFAPCPSTIAKLVPPPLVRKRSQRSSSRRNRSTPRKAERITPAPSPTEMVVLNASPKAVPSEVQEPHTSDDMMELDEAIGTAELEKAAAEAFAREEEQRRVRKQREWDECLRTFANACTTTSTSTDSGSTSPGEATPSSSSAGPSAQPTPWPEMSPNWGSTDNICDMVPHPTTLSPLALQMTPIVPPSDIAMMAMLSKADPDAMALDLTPEDLEELAAQLPPAGPPPLPAAPAAPSAAAPQPALKDNRSPPKKVLNIAPRPSGAPGALKPLKPKPVPDWDKVKEKADKEKAEKPTEKPKPVKQRSGSAPKLAPAAIAPAPAPPIAPATLAPSAPTSTPLKSPASAPASTPAPALQPAAPAPVAAPAAPPLSAQAPQAAPTPAQQAARPAPPLATALQSAPVPMAAPTPTPPTTAGSSATPSLPASKPPSQAPSQPASQTPSQAPSQAPSQGPSQAPTRTVSPVARTTTASPTGSVASASTSASTPSSTSSTQSRPGGTTKRLLPGIDACVVDNLPCYSHIWDNPKGGRCTVLRRLDTDFVNGTALLTALGVAPTRIPEFLNTPSPTLASHRTVPLISPQGMHHAPGVPGVWIPLVEARALAAKLGLQEATLLANILREDLFQLFKQLAGISLRHTSSTESFGMPFVTQPHGQRGKPPPRPQQVVRPPVHANGVQGNGKPPLVRQSTQQPDGCPQPKRRRSTVAVQGATGPQVMQQAGAQQQPQPQAQPPASGQPPTSTTVAAAAARKPAAPATPKAAPAPAPAQPPMTRAQQAKIAPAPPARRTRAALSGTK